MEPFYDRKEAGQVLAEHLKAYAGRKDVIVLGLPRGGVPVAWEVASALTLPLDIFIVRKLGMPGHDELAMGAIATGGVIVYNNDIIQNLHIDQNTIHQVMQVEQKELQRRELGYRQNRPPLNVDGKTVILVDDGMATGASVRAAIQGLRLQHPASIVVAVPVAANTVCEELIDLCDQLVCPLRPVHFNSVGAWYRVFGQTSDEEVTTLLAKDTLDGRNR